jgi:hypothetical protein
MSTVTGTRPVTPGQRAFIESLLRDRETAGTAYEGWTPDWDKATAAQASMVIEYLKSLPYKAGEQPKPGFYVMADGTAVKVQQNKAKTGAYGLVWSGSSWDYAPGVGRTVVGLTPMTAEQAAAAGLASGRCIACAKTLGGETLTAKVAAVIGYGEICANRHGWTFPKGAAAQRVFLNGRMTAEADTAH